METSVDTTLPAEILDTVFDELGYSLDSDRESLNALLDCALVCRSFHHRAAGHLFANVVVINRSRYAWVNYDYVAMKRLEDLSQILQKNDSIGPRILSFSLDTSLPRPHPNDSEIASAFKLRHGKTLPNVLRLLCSIRRFSWRNHSHGGFCKDLGLDLMDAIASLAERASLRSVSLECIELDAFPVPFLFKLDHLSFTDVFLRKEWNSSTPSKEDRQNECPTRLRELLLRESSNLAPWIAHTPTLFSRLTRLHVSMHNQDEVLLAWSVMQAACQTLEALNVSTIPNFKDPFPIPGPIDLGILGSLRTIAMSFGGSIVDILAFHRWTCGFFKPLTSPTQLENIEIKINLSDRLLGGKEARLLDDRWGALDEILSQESLHPKLTSVVLKFRMARAFSDNPRPPTEIAAIRETIMSLGLQLFWRTIAARSLRPKIDVEVY